MLLTLSIVIGITVGSLQDDADFRSGFQIMGGQDADIADYPYQVSLSTNGSHFCGGSLISPTWILTSAHCLVDLDASDILVLANSSYINTGIKTLVVKIIPHEKYSYSTAENDIALVQLASPLDCLNCKPIALAAAEPDGRETVVVTGWGRKGDYDPSDGSEILQYVEIPIVNRTACQEMYSNRHEFVTKGMICAASPEGGKDSCVGDSGGPAAVGDRLLGIVSWGIDCGDPDYPGVYTNVPEYLDWIEEYSGVEPRLD